MTSLSRFERRFPYEDETFEKKIWETSKRCCEEFH